MDGQAQTNMPPQLLRSWEHNNQNVMLDSTYNQIVLKSPSESEFLVCKQFSPKSTIEQELSNRTQDFQVFSLKQLESLELHLQLALSKVSQLCLKWFLIA